MQDVPAKAAGADTGKNYMITSEQIKSLQARVETLKKCLDIDTKRQEVEKKQARTLEPDFWDDPKEAEKFLKELAAVKFWVSGYDRVASESSDLDVLYDFAKESISGTAEDLSTPEEEELAKAYQAAESDVEALELRNMLGEEGDNLGAILTINSGAGGTEANDWSSMLMRMYMRWGERNGYKVTVTDVLEGEDAGIKSATIQFEGDYAFGYLKAESGVHRLVRISPFNAQGKRQTPGMGYIPFQRSRRTECQQSGDRSPCEAYSYRDSRREYRDPFTAG